MKNLVEANVVNKGKDVQFLLYLHTMLEILGEDAEGDTMYRLRNIIMNTDVSIRTKLNYKNASIEAMLTRVENNMKATKEEEENNNV